MYNFTHTAQQTLYKHICTTYTNAHRHAHMYIAHAIYPTHVHTHTPNILHTYTPYILLPHSCTHIHRYTCTHHTRMLHAHTYYTHIYTLKPLITHRCTHSLLRIPLPGQVLWGSTVCWLVWNSGTCSSSRFLLSSTWNGWRLGKSFQRRKWKINSSCSATIPGRGILRDARLWCESRPGLPLRAVTQ